MWYGNSNFGKYPEGSGKEPCIWHRQMDSEKIASTCMESLDTKFGILPVINFLEDFQNCYLLKSYLHPNTDKISWSVDQLQSWWVFVIQLGQCPVGLSDLLPFGNYLATIKNQTQKIRCNLMQCYVKTMTVPTLVISW